MGKTRRLALTLGLTLALGVDASLAFAAPANDKAAAENDQDEAGDKAADRRAARAAERANETPEEKLAKRRERLTQGAQRLRDRAAEMRKKAAAGETPPSAPNAKRPPRSYAEQAERLEE